MLHFHGRCLRPENATNIWGYAVNFTYLLQIYGHSERVTLQKYGNTGVDQSVTTDLRWPYRALLLQIYGFRGTTDCYKYMVSQSMQMLQIYGSQIECYKIMALQPGLLLQIYGRLDSV